VACGVQADGFEDRIDVDLRPNRCRVARSLSRMGAIPMVTPGAMTEARMVLVVDDDAAMRRWKVRFVRSDYGSQSLPRLRICSAALTRTCPGAEC
jgi:hypothetical protein